jgi:hypothetical protein
MGKMEWEGGDRGRKRKSKVSVQIIVAYGRIMTQSTCPHPVAIEGETTTKIFMTLWLT